MGRKDRTGEERLHSFGSKMVIKEYRGAMDIDVSYYYPSSWRKILGINKGKAKDKKLAAYNYLFEKGIFTEKFIQSGVKKNDDIVDSICIGIAYLKENL